MVDLKQFFDAFETEKKNRLPEQSFEAVDKNILNTIVNLG